MNRRTDLAIESCETVKDHLPPGVTQNTTEKGDLKITEIRIGSKEGAEALGRAMGSYTTIEMPPFGESAEAEESTIRVIAEAIGSYIEGGFPVLVAGLGNSDITPDALGPMVSSGIFATRHITKELAEEYGLGTLNPVCSITPGVLGQTGIETGEIVSCVASEIDAATVIAIDAFAAGSLNRLGCTIQISDSGISPGSGVRNSRKELSSATMNRKVIAIGVPTVVDAATIVADLQGQDSGVISEQAHDMIVTPRDVDLMIKRASKTLSLAINLALQPRLSMDDINSLVG